MEKGKINPSMNLQVRLLTDKLNNSVNVSMNANRRSMMQERVTRNIDKNKEDDVKIKQKLENLQKVRLESLQK